jgi:hypothetical protein
MQKLTACKFAPGAQKVSIQPVPAADWFRVTDGEWLLSSTRCIATIRERLAVKRTRRGHYCSNAFDPKLPP